MRGGDFDDFVRSAAGRMHRIAFALTGDRAASEDLVQGVLERMYVAWPRIDDPVVYGRRALVNASANRWRWRARQREIPLTEAHDLVIADDGPDHDRHDELVRAIATLPARQRSVVVLRFLEDLSEAETAAALGCSTGTVKSQTARAITRLRDLVKPEADDANSAAVPSRLNSRSTS